MTIEFDIHQDECLEKAFGPDITEKKLKVLVLAIAQARNISIGTEGVHVYTEEVVGSFGPCRWVCRFKEGI